MHARHKPPPMSLNSKAHHDTHDIFLRHHANSRHITKAKMQTSSDKISSMQTQQKNKTPCKTIPCNHTSKEREKSSENIQPKAFSYQNTNFTRLIPCKHQVTNKTLSTFKLTYDKDIEEKERKRPRQSHSHTKAQTLDSPCKLSAKPFPPCQLMLRHIQHYPRTHSHFHATLIMVHSTIANERCTHGSSKTQVANPNPQPTEPHHTHSS